jgi:hypothetical protein
MIKWPSQSTAELIAFYGNPRGDGGHPSIEWERRNLVRAPVPYAMWYREDAHTPVVVSNIAIHRRCADSLHRVLLAMTACPSGDSARFFSGSYCFRAMRGSNKLSMHSYGCAIDFDAEHNPFHSGDHTLHGHSPLVVAFEAEGWIWGGRWNNPDAMHFQAALT